MPHGVTQRSNTEQLPHEAHVLIGATLFGFFLIAAIAAAAILTIHT